jgi:hypothetical protein
MYRAILESFERIDRNVVRGGFPKFLRQGILFIQEPSQVAHPFTRHKGGANLHRDKIGHRVTMHGYPQMLAGFNPAEQGGGFVAKLSLGDFRSHRATP